MRKSKRAKLVGKYESWFAKKPYENVYKTPRGAHYIDKKAGVRKRKRYLRKANLKNIKKFR